MLDKTKRYLIVGDVYKRQPQHPRHPAPPPVHQRSGRVGEGQPAGPVSYTHLDVYKRQAFTISRMPSVSRP